MSGEAARCIWCNRSTGAVREVSLPMVDRFGGNVKQQILWVHAEHEEALRRFVAGVVRNARMFLAVVLLIAGAMLLLVICAAFSGSERWAAIGAASCTMLIAVTMVWFPFATPETVGAIGIHRAITLVRVLACGLFALGVSMMVKLY
jgi:hypothetical protein